ncbi:thiol reductant ABC exporter subunit CydD [Patulibacter sp. SYSU D01012]|uniref:thiol reductant ABC exporter subunit CydD n=1 Tax=Patulibacter sp. SYSU D01012 TaxID=2817381 RepID=UPI001B315B76
MGPPRKELLDAVPGLRAQLVKAVVLAVGESVGTIAQAVLLAHAIAIGVLGLDDPIAPTLIGLAAAVLVRMGFAAWSETSGRAAGRRAVAQLRERAVATALRRASESVGERRPGELAASWVHGSDAVATYVGRYLPASVVAGVAPILVFAAVLWFDPLSAGLLAIAAPIVVVFLILVGFRAQDAAELRHASLTLLGGHLLDVLRGLPVLRAYRREDVQAEQVRAAGEHYRAGTMATLREAFLSGLVLEFMAMLGTALVAVACGIRLAGGHMGFGDAIAALVLAPEVFLPLRRLGAEFHASADAEPLLKELAAMAGPGADDETHLPGATPAPAPAGGPVPDPGAHDLRLDGVVVRHPDRRDPALDGLTATLPAGRTTLLLGPSGSGKTTVLRLLLALRAADAGTVTCDGVDLRQVDRAAWHERIAWIPQHPVLLPASLRENVAFGRPADDDAVLDVLGRVGLGPLVASLPAGLDTPLGDADLPLSAGERRRLGVARALLRDPRLVLVDEPTANLDRVTAEGVTDALAALLAGRTAVVATHDELPRRLADHVLDVRPTTEAAR